MLTRRLSSLPGRVVSSWRVPRTNIPLCRSYTIVNSKKEPATPLGKELAAAIKFGGPMTLARYMKETLVHPQYGYYVTAGEEAFGQKGDFVTSPDISQMFGELIAIWGITQWEAQGAPKAIRLIELGPGRATLLIDMLRTMGMFPPVKNAIIGVDLVEVSSKMRESQLSKICSSNTAIRAEDGTLLSASLLPEYGSGQATVRWFDRIEEIPSENSQTTPAWPLLIAHEFFDALPVHRFRHLPTGWRELMVDVDESSDSKHHLRMVLAPAKTPASVSVFANPYMSAKMARIPIGLEVELSLDAWKISDHISTLLEKQGAGLIIDYGKDHPQGETLRAIRHHKFVDVLSSPGSADLSVDVDFSLLRDAIKATAVPHGPISQGRLLHALGIQARLAMLLRATPPARHPDLISGYKRLTERVSMGEIYKALAITPKAHPAPPVGFAPHDGDPVEPSSL